VGKRKPLKLSKEAIVQEVTFSPPAAGESTDAGFKRSLKDSPTFKPSRKHIVKVKPRLLKKQAKKAQAKSKK
jgi:hypothetical protein